MNKLSDHEAFITQFNKDLNIVKTFAKTHSCKLSISATPYRGMFRVVTKFGEHGSLSMVLNYQHSEVSNEELHYMTVEFAKILSECTTSNLYVNPSDSSLFGIFMEYITKYNDFINPFHNVLKDTVEITGTISNHVNIVLRVSNVSEKLHGVYVCEFTDTEEIKLQNITSAPRGYIMWKYGKNK